MQLQTSCVLYVALLFAILFITIFFIFSARQRFESQARTCKKPSSKRNAAAARTNAVLVENRVFRCATGGSLNANRLKKAALDAGEYILRMQREDGGFVYLYGPIKNEVIPSRYNIIRHAGVIYSLFLLYQSFPDQRYLIATRRALDF